MKLLILMIIALAGAVGLGMYASQDPGYVVFALSWDGEPVTVRMPMALFLLAALIGFFTLYLLVNFIVALFRAPKKVGKWRKGKQEISAQQCTMKGFANLVEGNWSDAEGHLLTKLDHNNASLMNYLGAAYAAQQQGQLKRRNQHLADALAQHPKQELAIKLTRARMQIQAGEWGEARDQLEYLRLSAPKNIAVLRLLADVYRELNDWPALVSLSPTLNKLKAFPEQELRQRHQVALQQHIEAPALLQGTVTKVDETFKALPRKSKQDPKAIASYVRQLIRAEEGQRAETVLRKALNKMQSNKGWNEELVTLYGLTETSNVRDQIKLLEAWGKDHNESPPYLLSMARLLRRNDQLDEARDLLARAVAATGSSESIAELGDLLEEMGEGEAALEIYKRGVIALSDTDKLQLPSNHSKLVALDTAVGDSESEVGDASMFPVVSGKEG